MSHDTTTLTGPLRLTALFGLALALMPLKAQDQTGTIDGHVIDAISGDALVGVNVYLSDTFWGAASDMTGGFSIGPLPPGRYDLRVERIGYEQHAQALIVRAGQTVTVEIALEPQAVVGQETIVEGLRRSDQPWRQATPSTYSLRARQLQIVPGAIEDVIKALQTLPGVMTASDFTNQLLVRGGGPDQNLILLDGVELYSPYKASGLSSTLNPDILGEVSLFTGGYPAIYGDRLSSVLSTVIREGGANSGFAGRIGLNLVNSSMTLEGKTFLIDGGWIVGIRRTHFDLFADSFVRDIGIFNDVAFPNFEDIQAKLVLRPFSGHVVQITGMVNLDRINVQNNERTGLQDSSAVSPVGNDAAYNDLLAASWSFAAGDRLHGSFYGNWYRNRGDSGFSGSLEPQDIVIEATIRPAPPPVFGAGEVMEFSYERAYKFVRQTVGTRWLLKMEQHFLEVGAGLEQLDNSLNFSMEVNDFGQAMLQALSSAPNWLGAVADTVDQVKKYNRWHLYLQEIWNPWAALTVQPSVRYDYYEIVNEGFVSPRLNVSYKLTQGGTSVNASWGQYVQSPGHEKILDLGRGSGLSPYRSLDGLKVEKATHLISGIERATGSGWHLRLEGYAKQFQQLLVQRLVVQEQLHAVYLGGGDGPIDRNSYNIRLDSALVTLAEAMNDATGSSNGLELLLEKRIVSPNDKLSGWLSYTYANTTRERTLDGSVLSIPFDYDRPHALDLVLNYRFGRANNWRLGVVWRYGTGFPYTPALRVQPLVASIPDPNNPDQLVNIIMADPETGIPRFVPDYGDQTNMNSARFPDYHRLDIRFAYTGKWSEGTWEAYIDIINAYNRKNVLYYQPVIEIAIYDEHLPIALRPLPKPILYREPVFMFPFIPTLGMSFTF